MFNRALLALVLGLRYPNFHQRATILLPRACTRQTYPLAKLLEMPKRKSLSTATEDPATTTVPILPPNLDFADSALPPLKRRASKRIVSQPATGSTNPNENAKVLDGPKALRASPDGDEEEECMDLEQAGMNVKSQVKEEESELSELSDISEPENPKKAFSKTEAPKKVNKKDTAAKESKNPSAKLAKKEAINVKEPQFLDPEADGDDEADEEEIQAALSRPPPVNSDYLPLPWKGRLGYVGTTCSACNR